MKTEIRNFAINFYSKYQNIVPEMICSMLNHNNIIECKIKSKNNVGSWQNSVPIGKNVYQLSPLDYG